MRLDDGWRDRVDPALLDGWQPAEFPLEGGTTEIVEIGRGPTVVLVPPLPGYKESWVGCAPRLAGGFRTITFDLRRRFGEGSAWDALVADLDRVIEARAVGPVSLVGHSLGGALAQRYALAHPERVRALVLSSSFARMRTPRSDAWARFVEQPVVLAGQRWLPERAALGWARRLAAREAWVYDPHCEDWILALVRHGIRSVPLAAGSESVRLAFDHDTRGMLARVACPTLVVRGERESRFVRDAAEELMREIPGATLAVSPGVGHLHPLSGAEWLAETIAAWLAPPLAA